MIESAESVAGWCSFSPYRPERQSLAGLIEISYYLDQGFHGKGIGSATIDFMLEEARRQLNAYFDGTLQDFDLPLAPEGTSFQRAVWGQLRRIPFGAA